jgi:hypothetical protein
MAQDYQELEGLAKMTISAYPSEEYDDSEVLKEFVMMYNPNSYSQEYKNHYEKPNVSGNTAPLVYKHTEPESVTFEYLFDATGASLSGKSNVADQVVEEGRTDLVIKDFIDITHDRQGDTHRPNFLKLRWGSFEFRGVLEQATVSHSLFNLDGNPIRSTVNCVFRKHTSLEEQAVEEKRNSPDMTHYRLVKAGETLPVIAHQTYGDASLYLELARINNLIDFRTLEPGIRLTLPPLKTKKA